MTQGAEEPSRPDEETKTFHDVVKELQEERHQIFAGLEEVHCEQFDLFLKHAIATVMEELDDTDEVGDHIDHQIMFQKGVEETVTCHTCGATNPKRKRVCVNCKTKEGLSKAKEAKKKPETAVKSAIRKESVVDILQPSETFQHEDMQPVTSDQRYLTVSSSHDKARSIRLTDPVFVNPNSFECIAEVLRSIGSRLGMKIYGGTRTAWTFICCDGLPYSLIIKLKEEAVICTRCSQQFLSKVKFENHNKEVHKDLPAQCNPEFNWFYLRIGAGHYEANLLKAFFDVSWDVVLQAMCVDLSFQSEGAQNFARKCKDHHTAWLLLLVFHLGKDFFFMIHVVNVPVYVKKFNSTDTFSC